MTWLADTPGPSARRRSGMPMAAAGSAIIRASWPPPTTATVGAVSDPGLTRDSVGARGPASDCGRLRRHRDAVPGRAGLETESGTTHRGDQRRLAGVVAELAADPPEVDVDGLRRRPEGGVPDREHQLVARDDVAGM